MIPNMWTLAHFQSIYFILQLAVQLFWWVTNTYVSQYLLPSQCLGYWPCKQNSDLNAMHMLTMYKRKCFSQQFPKLTKSCESFLMFCPHGVGLKYRLWQSPVGSFKPTWTGCFQWTDMSWYYSTYCQQNRLLDQPCFWKPMQSWMLMSCLILEKFPS